MHNICGMSVTQWRITEKRISFGLISEYTPWSHCPKLLLLVCVDIADCISLLKISNFILLYNMRGRIASVYHSTRAYPNIPILVDCYGIHHLIQKPCIWERSYPASLLIIQVQPFPRTDPYIQIIVINSSNSIVSQQILIFIVCTECI